MRSDPEMRMPYGPGWEEPDWTPHAIPRVGCDAMAEEAASPARPVVGTLAQFMAVVKQHVLARGRRPARDAVATAAALHPGQTRRWVMAGGAGLVAQLTFARGRAQGDEAATKVGDTPAGGR